MAEQHTLRMTPTLDSPKWKAHAECSCGIWFGNFVSRESARQEHAVHLQAYLGPDRETVDINASVGLEKRHSVRKSRRNL